MVSCSQWGMFEFPWPANEYMVASGAFMGAFHEVLYDSKYLHG